MAGQALQVVRWRRYGKDRLYVNDAAGQSIGWLDLVTGERHVLAGQDARFDVAIAQNSAGVQALQAPVEPALTALPPVGTLARNSPGQALAVQARLAQERAPVITFFARLLGIHTEERAWRIGLQGERLVGNELGRLDARWWRVLHSIPVGAGSSDIDHVVIGPAGVFTLNTKHHPGGTVWVGGEVVLVNGQRYPYIRNTRHEAARAARLLTRACGFEVQVFGALVIAGAERFTIRTEPAAGAAVVAKRKLVRWLRKQPVRLRAADVDHIYHAASNPQTWLT